MINQNFKGDIDTPPINFHVEPSNIMSIVEVQQSMPSGSLSDAFNGMQMVRKLLSRATNSPIKKVSKYSVVLRTAIKFLQDFGKPALQYEAAWVLTNITAGTSEKTRYVIENGAVQHLIALLHSKHLVLVRQAIWVLSNIAGDSVETRDIVMQHNVIDNILRFCGSEIPLSLIYTIVWLISNLVDKSPSIPLDEIRRLLPILLKLLSQSDTEVLHYACWALSHITDNMNHIQAVVDSNAVPRLVALLGSSEPQIIFIVLRIIGNIINGTDYQVIAN